MLEGWLDEAVRSVINIDRYNAQVEAEKKDSAAVLAFKKGSVEFLKALRTE